MCNGACVCFDVIIIQSTSTCITGSGLRFTVFDTLCENYQIFTVFRVSCEIAHL